MAKKNNKHKNHNKAVKLAKGKRLKKYRSVANDFIKQAETNEKLKGYDIDPGFLDNF